MRLDEYHGKRNFSRTSELKGEIGEGRGQRIYLIQEHHATHLHWDLRLEVEGVLRSWAVPKEPPEEVGVRRLAVEVEDHPLDYASFEGTIAKGEYGAGEVKIWDRGTYDPIEISGNKIIIDISGERLKGKYCLLRTQFRGEAKNWLFFKMKA